MDKSSNGPPPVGIIGMGHCLPTTVRDNSWWPANVVAGWGPRAVPPLDGAGLEEDERRVIRAMAQLQGDPFQGTQRRHVIDGTQLALDLELIAARAAIANAGLAPTDIDMLLTHSAVPDYLCTNTACSLHEKLGLSRSCFSLSTEAASNSFLMQAAIAEQAIRGGAARHALLVQSATFSRILPPEADYSPLLGDAATAVVLGRVGVGLGFMAWQHRTDGSMENTLIAGVPGKRWFDDGRVFAYPENHVAARRMFLSLATFAKEVGTAALAEAGLTPRDVAFFGSHQGTSWFREVTQGALDLSNAKFVDTFRDTASVFSANVPLCLHLAQQRGLIKRGDIVMVLAGGGGTTYTCGIMKWSI